MSIASLFVAIAVPAHSAMPVGKCEQVDPSTFASPDGKWTAKLYGEVCDLGLSTSASVVIDLYRPNDPSISQTVLGIDMPSSRNLWPKPKWVSAKKLVVQLSPHNDIGLLVALFQGVAIEARACPASAAERAAWISYKAAYHKWIGDFATWTDKKLKDSNLAGPRPVAPTPPVSIELDLSCDLDGVAR